MATFHAPLPSMAVALHDEAGKRLGYAQFRGGYWTAPDDALADALRRAHVYGVVEVAEKPRPAARKARQKPGRKPPVQMHGAITGTPSRNEEDDDDA